MALLQIAKTLSGRSSGTVGSLAGFTIIELMIATAIFSLVLLGALSGFLQIGKVFYKGVSSTNTQDVANQILQDVSDHFRTSGSFVSVPPGATGNNYAYYCIGNARYTYNINHEVNVSDSVDHSPGGHYGLLKDILPGSTACATPCNDNTQVVPNCPPGSSRFINPTEMLGDKMRLSALDITPAANGSSFYNVSIVVAYGQDDAFNNLNDPANISCNAQSGLDQFCSVSRLNTSVYKGFGL